MYADCYTVSPYCSLQVITYITWILGAQIAWRVNWIENNYTNENAAERVFSGSQQKRKENTYSSGRPNARRATHKSHTKPRKSVRRKISDKRGENACVEAFARSPSSVGGGSVAMILSTWLIVEEPGNSGLPSSISPKMQPSDHMSIPFVYLRNKQSTRLNMLRIYVDWGWKRGNKCCLPRLKIFEFSKDMTKVRAKHQTFIDATVVQKIYIWENRYYLQAIILILRAKNIGGCRMHPLNTLLCEWSSLKICCVINPFSSLKS